MGLLSVGGRVGLTVGCDACIFLESDDENEVEGDGTALPDPSKPKGALKLALSALVPFCKVEPAEDATIFETVNLAFE